MSDYLTLKVDNQTNRVSNRESEHREFKLQFDANNLPKLARTMASYANRDGGAIFFGIKDRPREIVGVEENNIPDDVVITNFLKEYFQPEILFQSKTFELQGFQLHALSVKASNRKPVICKKSKSIRLGQGKPEKTILREGAIYYRYSAASDEIKYGDLRLILDKEREAFFRSMVDNITLLNRVGMEKAAVIDAQELAGSDQAASVFLTNETARNLNWIDSGKFVDDQQEGEKAYYVVRKVEIKQGVEIPTPSDFASSHPLTKTALTKEIKIFGVDFDAVTWKLGIKDNKKYHYSSRHGKNNIHKYTEEARDVIIADFPLDLERRRETIKLVAEEYKSALRS